ncbi:MAG: hypothetical protein ACREEQ_00905, partial [Caulobacteraceae bacterium]
TADLAFQLSASPQGGFGYFSPYIAAAMDIARILGSMHTAQYQYIPALPLDGDGDRLSLLLNAAPSFHNPKSVLVAALPAVASPRPPPLRPAQADGAYCAEQPGLVLPLEGAPLAYSTRYAHDLALRVTTKSGATVDLPLTPDAEKGGFDVETAGLNPARFGPTVEGRLHGLWGFETFEGPAFTLQNAGAWRLAPGEDRRLIVGRDDDIRLEGQGSACVESVEFAAGDDGAAVAKPVSWKADGAGAIAATLPLKDARPGPGRLAIESYGVAAPQTLDLKAFAQDGHLASFSLHAGDTSGVLKGARLDEVARLTLGKLAFEPGALANSPDGDVLLMTATESTA